MNDFLRYVLFCVVLFSIGCHSSEQPPGYDSHNRQDRIYHLPSGEVHTRWFSFENPQGARGKGGMSNRQAKGNAYIQLRGGDSVTLCDVKGAGIINRIWMTTSCLLGYQGLDKYPREYMLRALRIDIYWDNASKPAVSAPLGDFFGMGLGRTAIPFDNEFFSRPEGRSLNCFIPMPFRQGARIVLTNESDGPTNIFYTINMQKMEAPLENAGYLHCAWRRNRQTELGKDFVILPTIHGRGRFLGANFSVITDPAYEKTWWGEGEVKIYLDGDEAYPTLNGTGTEDYVGTGWGQGLYDNPYQGSLLVPDGDFPERKYAFYRYHIPDPVYFHRDIKATIQVMGSSTGSKVAELIEKGVPLQPVTVVRDQFGENFEFNRLLEMEENVNLMAEEYANSGVVFYRSDDWAATAYFYLDSPENDLPPLAPLQERTFGTVKNF